MPDRPHPRITEREMIHRGKKFDFERVNLAPEGEKPVWREVVRHPGAVCVLPLLREDDTGEDRIIMIRNHRFAIGGDAGSTLWELPAGTREPDEPAEDTAKRELIEEAGYEAGSVEPLLSFYTTPGMTDERMDALLATDLTEVGQRLEEDERIEVRVLGAGEVMAMIDRGEILDGKTVTTLLFAVRKRLLRVGEGSDVR
jgi:ADP-ribose pyrophosphatase